jgi:glycosyltransferase involved in cell wall biosynthesis
MRDYLATVDFLPTLKVVQSMVPGQVMALNAALDAATGDIVAITDDDAVPHPDWTLRIEEHFKADPKLGGLGGRDLIYQNGKVVEGKWKTVGTFSWFGRKSGNHHLAEEYIGPVDNLKGANMSYRMAAIGAARFDQNLRGSGAQVCNDMAFSMHIKKKGWRLLYDYRVKVDHFHASRGGQIARGDRSLKGMTDEAFNHYFSIAAYHNGSLKRTMALLWQRLIGSPSQRGLIPFIFRFLGGDRDALRHWRQLNQARNEAVAELAAIQSHRD